MMITVFLAFLLCCLIGVMGYVHEKFRATTKQALATMREVFSDLLSITEQHEVAISSLQRTAIEKAIQDTIALSRLTPHLPDTTTSTVAVSETNPTTVVLFSHQEILRCVDGKDKRHLAVSCSSNNQVEQAKKYFAPEFISIAISAEEVEKIRKKEEQRLESLRKNGIDPSTGIHVN